MQNILSRFKKRDSIQKSPVHKQEQVWPASGLLISGDFLPLVHKFEDIFDNSAAMMYFMKFLEQIDMINSLKFWIHIEGFKSCNDLDELKNDALHIYKTYIIENSQYYIDLPTNTQNDLEKVLNSEDSGLVGKIDCFDEAQRFVWNELKSRYFKDFLNSPYYLMHKVEVYKVGSLQLTDILEDHQVLRLFADFMEIEGRLNLLEFIMAVENFSQLTNQKSEIVIENAMLIYNRFFQIDARDALNFDPIIRNQIEENICTKNGTPPLDTFERGRQAAHAILETRFIPMFVKSKSFFDFIDKISCFIAKELSPRSRQSISSLQSGEINEKRSASSIDEDRISQCSSAYSSEMTNKMGSLARIDTFGRYESLFDNNSMCSNNDLQSNRGLRNMINRYVKQPIVQEDPQSYEEAIKIVENLKQTISRSQSSASNSTLNSPFT